MRKIIIVSVFLFCFSWGLALAAESSMTVGFVYVSPIGDAGWSFAHDQGRWRVWPLHLLRPYPKDPILSVLC